MRKWLVRLYWLITGLGLSIFVSGLLIGGVPGRTVATTQPIPTTPWQNTQLPDWNQITFRNIPGIGSSGSFNAPADVIRQLGYDPSRSWSAGQTPDQYVKLGDFQD
ncbi:MAG: hypothetical protein F6J89_08225, partial [Symploca sp. SIO1C4]|nr:hypothetical protein [Symploca sp. SIO1C4]